MNSMFVLMAAVVAGDPSRSSTPTAPPPEVLWAVIAGFVGLIVAIKVLSLGWGYSSWIVRRLSRFYGYRKLFALLTAPLAAMVTAIAMRMATAASVSATTRGVSDFIAVPFWTVAFGCWWQRLVTPLQSLNWNGDRLRRLAALGGWIVVISAATAILFNSPGGVAAPAPDKWTDNLPIVGLRTAVPITVGVLVAVWPDIKERVQSNNTVRRLFVSGQGHAADWLGPVGMKRFIRRLPRVPKTSAGHRSADVYLGRTLFESTYGGGEDVWLRERGSSLLTVARPGSGKFILAAPSLAMARNGVFVSTKAELADFGVGGGVDQSLFAEGAEHSFRSLGVDTRGITRVKYSTVGGRVFVLDITSQSGWASRANCHNFISEIDVNDPSAWVRINAIATASFPDDLRQREKFWTLAPRGLDAASIGHVLTSDPDPSHHNLPYCADFCMGIDPVERRADPDVFRNNLLAMMQNRHPNLGPFIQRSASAVLQLGSNAFGSVNAEFENNTRWLADQRVRKQISGPSDFSYEELGSLINPLRIFLIGPRSSTDMQALMPWLRTHIELSLAILETKKERPAEMITYQLDEVRQYGQSISAIRLGATTLREAGVRLWLLAQSWKSVIEILGEHGADELEACSALEFYGTDEVTAEKISRMLGKHRSQGRSGDRPDPFCDVATPAEVMHELRKGSPLKYVFPATSGPMRLRRVAYKPLITEEGIRYPGLRLDGHYDEHLSQYRYGPRPQ